MLQGTLRESCLGALLPWTHSPRHCQNSFIPMHYHRLQTDISEVRLDSVYALARMQAVNEEGRGQ